MAAKKKRSVKKKAAKTSSTAAIKKPKTKEEAAKIRVQIAKDVIKQVTTNAFIATRGQYLDTDSDWAFSRALDAMLKRGDDEKHIKQKVRKCQACAIGSVFVAAFNRFDAIPAEEFGSMEDEAMIEYLRQWFSEKQLRLMEIAFEPPTTVDTLMRNVCLLSDEARKHAQDFRDKVVDQDPVGGPREVDRAVLLAIMENVVANKGEFIPVKFDMKELYGIE